MPRKRRAAVEACASTGGVLLPPIMGSTAFIMATFLELPTPIAFAALIPALLYFFALFYSLTRMPQTWIGWAPRVRRAKTSGCLEIWLAFFAVVRTIGLFLIGTPTRDAGAVAASAVLLLINQVLPQHRMDRAGWLNWSRSIGQLLMELLTILCAVGLIVGAVRDRAVWNVG